jgi:hypothetical protein
MKLVFVTKIIKMYGQQTITNILNYFACISINLDKKRCCDKC